MHEAMMEGLVLHLLPLRRQPLWLRYSGSTLLVGLAALLRTGLHRHLHDYSFYFFVPSVLFAAFLFGRSAAYWVIVSVCCCRSVFSLSRTTA